jgi:hypothetical protein
MTSNWLVVVAYGEEALGEFFTGWFNDCVLVGGCLKSRVSLGVGSAPVNVFKLEVEVLIMMVSL